MHPNQVLCHYDNYFSGYHASHGRTVQGIHNWTCRIFITLGHSEHVCDDLVYHVALPDPKFVSGVARCSNSIHSVCSDSNNVIN